MYCKPKVDCEKEGHCYVYSHEENIHHTIYHYQVEDCPYCEIDRLKGELEEARQNLHICNVEYGDVRDSYTQWKARAEAAEKERDELKGQLTEEKREHKDSCITIDNLTKENGRLHTEAAELKAQLSRYAGAVEVEGKVYTSICSECLLKEWKGAE